MIAEGSEVVVEVEVVAEADVVEVVSCHARVTLVTEWGTLLNIV